MRRTPQGPSARRLKPLGWVAALVLLLVAGIAHAISPAPQTPATLERVVWWRTGAPAPYWPPESRADTSSNSERSFGPPLLADSASDLVECHLVHLQRVPQPVQRIVDGIPVDLRQEVLHWARFFGLGPGRWSFRHWLARVAAYRPMIERTLAREGLPTGLLYLAMIESGYDPVATSQAGAVGHWQFIPKTGAHYGLRIDVWTDERRDPVRSADAAARYLADLYDEFQDWRLAWAAYNTGPSRVRRLIDRLETKDWWRLLPHLHPETQHYVPRIMGAAIAARCADRLELLDVEPAQPPTFDTVLVMGPLHLHTLATAANLSTSSLHHLNPALLHQLTPPGVYPLRLPAGSLDQVAEVLGKLDVTARYPHRRHVTRPGDTVESLARRFSSHSQAIRDVNGLGAKERLPPGTALTIPEIPHVQGTSPPTTSRKSAPGGPSSSREQDWLQYKVRRGDTLPQIARSFGVSLEDLRQWNQLRSLRIVTGQRLRIQR